MPQWRRTRRSSFPADGRAVTTEYDAWRRPTRKTIPDALGGAPIVYDMTYRPGGQRATVTDPRGTTNYGYDEAGRLAAVVTRDAEFDHFEAAREGFVHLLPALAARAGADGMAWLAEAGRAAKATGGALALVGGTLIDGTGRAPVTDSVVVMTGGKIVAAGPRAATPIPSGATTIDVAGKAILPGLWDMHAHVQQVEQAAVLEQQLLSAEAERPLARQAVGAFRNHPGD